MGIESVVKNIEKAVGTSSEATCAACEMAVVWMQNKLKQNETQQHVIDYANDVRQSSSIFFFKSLSLRNTTKHK